MRLDACLLIRACSVPNCIVQTQSDIYIEAISAVNEAHITWAKKPVLFDNVNYRAGSENDFLPRQFHYVAYFLQRNEPTYSAYLS